MAMTPITPLDRTAPTFKSDLDQFFLTEMPRVAEEFNAGIGDFNAALAGGAYAFPFVFDSATVDADPGPGELRLSSATQNAATALRIDVLTMGGASLSALFDTLQSVTSAVKGAVRIVKSADPSKWLLFDVTAVGTGAGYRNMTVAHRAGSAASPFANGDALMVYIDRNGDKGEDAVGALQLLATATVGAAVAQVDFLNIFTSAYDKYIIEVQNFTLSASNWLRLRLASGGVVDTRAVYDDFNLQGPLPLLSQFQLNSDTGTSGTFTIEVRNANTLGTKSVGVRGTFNGTLTPAGPRAVVGEGACRITETLSGFRLSCASANITTGTVRVYGVKNVQ